MITEELLDSVWLQTLFTSGILDCSFNCLLSSARSPSERTDKLYSVSLCLPRLVAAIRRDSLLSPVAAQILPLPTTAMQ
jgi:hypothetical protein